MHITTYWPPSPQPDSWSSDAPNEGITVDAGSGELFLYSANESYHGTDIYLAGDWNFPDGSDTAYLVAYKALEALPVVTEDTCRACLTSLGWRAIEVDNDPASPHEFRWADTE